MIEGIDIIYIGNSEIDNIYSTNIIFDIFSCFPAILSFRSFRTIDRHVF